METISKLTFLHESHYYVFTIMEISNPSNHFLVTFIYNKGYLLHKMEASQDCIIHRNVIVGIRFSVILCYCVYSTITFLGILDIQECTL